MTEVQKVMRQHNERIIKNEDDIALCYKFLQQESFSYQELLQKVILWLDIKQVAGLVVIDARKHNADEAERIANNNQLLIKNHAETLIYKVVLDGILIYKYDEKLYLV